MSTERQLQSDTRLLINMDGKKSWATLYLLPHGSKNAVILDEWHHQVKKFQVRNFKFLERVLTKEFHIKRTSDDSPCVDGRESTFYKVSLSRRSQESNERSNFKHHTTFLLFKCLGDLATRAFREKNPCENVTVPCWIPQAHNIVDKSIITALPICDTLEKYTCMLKKLKDSKYASPLQCHKSCIAEDYKTLSRTADIEPFTRVRCKEQ